MTGGGSGECRREWGVDLAAEARAGRLDPMVGRESILERVLLILARKTKNNPVLLGPPGVGKTAIAEGLAIRMAGGDVPPRIRGRDLFSLNLGGLLAGTGCRGDFEQRLQLLVSHLRRPEIPRVLFIDEIHLLIRAGRSEGGLDGANLLKPLLARGALPCLGATTPAEWAAMLAEDPALERRFQPVEVPPATPGETHAILAGLRPGYEAHHGVTIDDDALAAAVDAAIRDPCGRLLPDRAIDLLDEACARLGMLRRPAELEIPATRASLIEAMDRFDLPRVALLLHSRATPPSREPPRLCAKDFGTTGATGYFRL